MKLLVSTVFIAVSACICLWASVTAAQGPPTRQEVPDLIRALEKGENVQATLARLHGIIDERAVVPVSRYINDPTWDTANLARGALRIYGELSVSTLTGLTKDTSYHDAALDVLKDIEPSASSLKLVRPLAGSENELERAGAGFVLGWWGDRESEEKIMALMGDDTAEVREKAATGYKQLHQANPERFNIDFLLKSFSDTDADVRKLVARMLRLTPDKKIVAPLLERLKTEGDAEVRRHIIAALANTGDETVIFPLMERMQTENDPDAMATVIYALGELKAKEAVPQIVGIMTGEARPHYSVQKEAFMTFVKIGEPVELGQFLKYLEHGDPHHTSTIELLDLIDAQAKPGDEEIIAALEKYKEGEDNPNVVKKADSILEKLR